MFKLHHFFWIYFNKVNKVTEHQEKKWWSWGVWFNEKLTGVKVDRNPSYINTFIVKHLHICVVANLLIERFPYALELRLLQSVIMLHFCEVLFYLWFDIKL